MQVYSLITLLLLTTSLSKPSWQDQYPVHDIRGRDAFEQTRKTHQLTVTEFFTEWCIDCKHAAPELHKLSQEYKDNKNIKVVRIDIDLEENEELKAKYNIMSIPTMLIFTSHSTKPDHKVPQQQQTYDKVNALLKNKYSTQLNHQVDTKEMHRQEKAEQQEQKVLIDEQVLQQNYLDLKDLKFGDQDKQELLHSIVQITDILSSKMDHNNNNIQGLIDEILINAKQKVQENNDFQLHIKMTAIQALLILLAGFISVIGLLLLRKQRKQ